MTQTAENPAGNGVSNESMTADHEQSTANRSLPTDMERAMFNEVFPEPPLPRIRVIEEYVRDHIFRTRDSGTGYLRALPWPGSEHWDRATDAEKWAVVATLALQGLWATERGPEERIAYAEAEVRVDAGFEWAAYAYRLGYDTGRRDQKVTDRRIQSGIARRKAGEVA